MKQIYILSLLLIGILTGCGSNKKDTKAETQRMFQLESVDENTGLQRMQVSQIKQEITCKGKNFQLSVERTPDDKLPQVKSDMWPFRRIFWQPWAAWRRWEARGRRRSPVFYGYKGSRERPGQERSPLWTAGSLAPHCDF